MSKPKRTDRLDPFTRAYIQCALETETDENTQEPLARTYQISDITAASLADLAEDCLLFMRDNATDLAAAYDLYKPLPGDSPEGCAGHDLWLTRNGHGAGFWDRDLGEVGDRLSAAAKKLGESNLYVGDNGRIYAYAPRAIKSQPKI